MLSNSFNELMKETEQAITSEIVTLYGEFVKASPVGGYRKLKDGRLVKIKGYIGGSFRSAWSLDKNKKYSWSISNNMEYADILFAGRRKVGKRWLGSEQWADGGEPMLKEFEHRIENRLNSLQK